MPFGKHLGSAAPGVRVKIQSGWKSLKPNLAASRLSVKEKIVEVLIRPYITQCFCLIVWHLLYRTNKDINTSHC